MAERVVITVGDVTVKAEFFDTTCAKAVVSALPLEAAASEWGDEFYFTVPVDEPLDDTAARVLEVGDIGYWPPGRALAIFFGPTPASPGDAPVAASEVNVVGRIVGDAKVLRQALGATRIVIEKRE